MRKFLTAIAGALTSGFQALGRCVAAPLRWLFGTGGGGDAGQAEQIEDILDGIGDAAAERERHQENALVLAGIVTRYAAHSVIDDAPAPLPKELTPELKAWCRGLSKDECLTLCAADETSVSAHIQSVFTLDGVRKVGPLPTAQWSRASSHDYGDALDLQPTFSI